MTLKVVRNTLLSAFSSTNCPGMFYIPEQWTFTADRTQQSDARKRYSIELRLAAKRSFYHIFIFLIPLPIFHSPLPLLQAALDLESTFVDLSRQQNVSIIFYWRSLINCRNKVDLTILVSCSLILLHLFNSPDIYEMIHKTIYA